ncbi:hypothetical protein Bca52824_049279 [Brassica carinata]|uniref:PI-PLC Y-box domain-containing protein n=1 Tax=Brassica carinata TaxID=52824 RepID=A0A8X7RMT8_BRACI|nr:hypothetical protein Bca52824_049279 [Brassica carinata]
MEFYKKGKQLTEEPVEDISKGHTTRLTSSKYKPFNAWVYGAQMVAFNMQVCSLFNIYQNSITLDASFTFDLHGYRKTLWMMQYMKKPDFMMNKGPEGEVFDPKAKLPTNQDNSESESIYGKRIGLWFPASMFQHLVGITGVEVIV